MATIPTGMSPRFIKAWRQAQPGSAKHVIPSLPIFQIGATIWINVVLYYQIPARQQAPIGAGGPNQNTSEIQVNKLTHISFIDNKINNKNLSIIDFLPGKRVRPCAWRHRSVYFIRRLLAWSASCVYLLSLFPRCVY